MSYNMKEGSIAYIIKGKPRCIKRKGKHGCMLVKQYVVCVYMKVVKAQRGEMISQCIHM